MAGLHCTDCLFSHITKSKQNDEYYGSCTKGYTLTSRYPHECELPSFAKLPESLYPTVDPYGKRYLGTDWICPQFRKNSDGTRRVAQAAERKAREAGSNAAKKNADAAPHSTKWDY